MTVRVVAHISARPDTIDAMRDVLKGLLQPTRMEAGCLRYELLQNLHDPTDFTFVEEWRTDADLTQHLAAPHLQAAHGEIEGLSADAPSVQTYRVIG
ncbi:MAG: putative quinol monooxygenase [Planctomycetota bacterium]